MPDKSWKRAERMIAKDCGGQRIPVTGERHGADVGHPMFAYQLKVRRALPAWLFAWLDGICGAAKQQQKVGVLVLNRPRRPRRDALVILRWADWCELHGTVGVDGGAVDSPETVEPSKSKSQNVAIVEGSSAPGITQEQEKEKRL